MPSQPEPLPPHRHVVRRTLTAMPTIVADLIDRALAGFDALAATAEPVADELQ